MGLLREALNRLRTLLNTTSGQKSQLYPDQDNETPVGNVAADGGSGARKEKNTRKRKRFWRWHSRKKKYSVAKAEKLYQTSVSETGTYRTHNQGKVDILSNSYFIICIDWCMTFQLAGTPLMCTSVFPQKHTRNEWKRPEFDIRQLLGVIVNILRSKTSICII